MFTGIIEKMGRVVENIVKNGSNRLIIEQSFDGTIPAVPRLVRGIQGSRSVPGSLDPADKPRDGELETNLMPFPFDELHPGESIAVNGVCLTLLPEDSHILHFDLSPETLNVTGLKDLVSGDYVNLERAMFATNRFGGHYVSGHVDDRAQVQSIHALGECLELKISGFSESAMLYLIPKGSITLDGVSLTINTVINRTLSLMLVPHTVSNTTLGLLKAGQQINIEFDYLTRIVAHQLQLFGKLNSEVQL